VKERERERERERETERETERERERDRGRERQGGRKEQEVCMSDREQILINEVSSLSLHPSPPIILIVLMQIFSHLVPILV
jgi:hypothetical protein